jgi:hypothetical protein
MFPRSLTPLLLIFFVPPLCADETAKPSVEGLEFFEKKIRPLLVEHCYDCHSGDSAESELVVDSRAALLAGGTRGPAIVPGEPKKSLLIVAVNHGEVLQMPKDKLPSARIAELSEWVRMGAPWPNAETELVSRPQKSRAPKVTEAARQFWSFQPIGEVKVPATSNDDWCRNPIDHFVLRKLNEAGLTPSPPTDKRKLIRRATYDLTGLPPTPGEINAFLADGSPDAFRTVIDRLLDSPRYGERWGRHWLDVARYADSNGLDENLAYANAFRYRDYVIRSFNDDKPFDRFLQEQIAGDLLPAGEETESQRYDRLTATAFLSLGPKMLAEDDPVKMQMDIIDEQLDTTSRAFMGLTLGCARCHDHKFDPIPTKDYYSLAGIFKSTKTMENHKVVAVWHEYELPDDDYRSKIVDHEQQIATAQAKYDARREFAVQAAIKSARQQTADYLIAASHIINGGAVQPNGTIAVGDYLSPEDIAKAGHLRECEDYDRGTFEVNTTTWGKDVGVLLNQGYAEYDFDLPGAGSYQFELRYAAKDSRPVKISINGKSVNQQAAAGITGGWYADAQRWHLEGVHSFNAGRNLIRIEKQNGAVCHLDKLLVVRVDDQPSIDAPIDTRTLVPEFLKKWVEAFNTQDGTRLRRELESLERAKIESIVVDSLADAESAVAKQIRAFIDAADGTFSDPKQIEKRFAEADKKELKKLKKKVDEINKNKPSTPKTMGVTEGTIQNEKVHLRGSHITLGREVPRQFLAVVRGDQPTPISGEVSGRLEFARWLANPEHPLTARVIANRIWRWHFGTGIVASTDNLGRLGDRPTHPQLLDWLASQLINEGWSIKSLHRIIMLSNTWQQSTMFDQSSADIDPDNKLLWRMNRRRLEAEEVRDSIIAVGEGLDLTVGGQLLPNKNRDYVTGTGSKQATYEVNRRSVYLPILRSAVYQVLQAFDFGDPSVINGARSTTTIAPQALFMMNSNLVAKNAEALAKRLIDETADDASRIDRAFQMLFGRPPAVDETVDLRQVVTELREQFAADKSKAANAEQLAWRSLCRILMSSNEFIYVE